LGGVLGLNIESKPFFPLCAEDKSAKESAMKSIATVNFKGGVGKTTVSWILAKYAAEKKNKKVLVIDTDAQMSLTLAVQLQESGSLVSDFETWYESTHKGTGKTLLAALEKYDTYAAGKEKHFDFSVGYSFIYRMSDNLHFVPSTVDLYWLELEVFDKAATKDFVRSLLGKIQHAKTLPRYDYVFFHCPPNFTALSYSVLSCTSLILVPINPDVFASRGIELMIDGLQLRIQPWPNPKIGVFMNKAKLYRGALTRETNRYWDDSKHVCNRKRTLGIEIDALESYIPDRVNIKRAIPGKEVE
jgi:cellulose biosynthesis protein BcsQ